MEGNPEAIAMGVVLGVVLLLVVVGRRSRSKSPEEVEAEAEAAELLSLCLHCEGETLEPEGVFPGGSCVERCLKCGAVRLWVVEDGQVPQPEDFTADEWSKQDHEKLRQKQIRGREWGSIGVSPGPGE